ncbi:type II toxin-antitoxin system Phd/YefM family antitoxin [Agromyces sp. NPDC058484]|uniref:type II toxin-antitoxin system Phd/YefM family antitoxin n=1 Tax=Agromyces sp. NPDC058484 TaxID=3346524 RepID=UPI0036693383
MSEVGIRALKQNASAVVSAVEKGQVVTITDRGRPVAQLSPLSTGRLARLLASGRARAPRRELRDLPMPAPMAAGGDTLSAALRDARDDERY